MRFSMTLLSLATLAISSTTILANPIAQPAAAEQLEDHKLLSAEETEAIKRAAEILETRQGWTCSFLGGDKACQVKCFALKGTGGYCSSKNVCTCHS